MQGVPERLRSDLAAMIETGGWPLVLVGDRGVGKTMAAGLMYANRPRSEMVGWFSARTLLREIAQARNSEGRLVEILRQDGVPARVEYLHAWNQILRARFVVIDDIGTRELTPAQSEIFLEILDIRGHRLPTVYTSNHDADQLGTYLDARIVSRLFQGTTVRMSGPDRRMEGGRVFDDQA